MAEICTRKRCVAEIEDIVVGAEERIVLVSPYIKADEDIVERLKQKIWDVEVVVIYGKDEHQPRAKSLCEAGGLTRIFVKDLHSKCYLNEKKALVTSMNLYEYSQNNNEEMGVLVSREVDRELYEGVIGLVKHWESIGKKQSLIHGLWRSVKAALEPEAESADTPRSRRKKATTKTQEKKVVGPAEGFCIRCGDGIDINLTDLKPYCTRCFKKWQRSKQTEEYREKHCHLCGKESKTSLIKPACWSCYKKYKDVVKFEAA